MRIATFGHFIVLAAAIVLVPMVTKAAPAGMAANMPTILLQDPNTAQFGPVPGVPACGPGVGV